MEAGACGNNRQKWANPPQEFQTPCVARHPEQSRTFVISVQTALFADFRVPSDQLPTSPFLANQLALIDGLLRRGDTACGWFFVI
jgi:hypothetical protein